MKKAPTPCPRLNWSICGGLALACLTACQPTEKPKVEPKPAAVDLGDLTKRFLDPNYAIGALVIGQKGELIAVDKDGNQLKPCRLPGDPKQELPECAAVTNTTIEDISPVSFVRHTGSKCIKGTITNAGYASTYSWCW